MLDIFNQNAFSVTTLAEVMREIKYVPSLVGRLGLFSEYSIDTLDFAIEKDKDQIIKIVPASPRGGVGDTVGKGRRSIRKLGVPHFQRDDAIYADEIQSRRALGEERARMSFQAYIANRAAEHSVSFALTEEYHRLAVITQGKLLDADGSTLVDFYSEMGEVAPTEIDFDLDNANPAKAALREKCDDLWRAMAATLDGLPFTGIIALCGDAFFKDLVKHKEVYDLYLAASGAATLSLGRSTIDAVASAASSTWGEVTFGNIRFINYRGGQSVNIDTDKAYFVPLGVPGLFRTVYAPADYMETVNTMGQRMYAKVWPMANSKGMNLEYQTNVLHYVQRPRVLMRARRT